MFQPDQLDCTPTKEELATLPRGAILAFAARCSRRVQPLYAMAWRAAPRKCLDAIERAIGLAETASSTASEGPELRLLADLACEAVDFAIDQAESETSWNDDQVLWAATFAARSADCAASTVAVENVKTAASWAASAGYASAYGVEMPQGTIAYDSAAAAWAARADFDLLVKLAAQHAWTDASTIDLTLLGPLRPPNTAPAWAMDW